MKLPIIFLITFGVLSACKGDKGDPGPQGAQGEAAYFTFNPGLTVILQGATLSDGVTDFGGDSGDDTLSLTRGETPYFRYANGSLDIWLYEYFNVISFDGSFLYLSISLGNVSDRTTISDVRIEGALEKQISSTVLHEKYLSMGDAELSNQDNIVVNEWNYDANSGKLKFSISVKDDPADADQDGNTLSNFNVSAMEISGEVPVVTVLSRRNKVK